MNNVAVYPCFSLGFPLAIVVNAINNYRLGKCHKTGSKGVAQVIFGTDNFQIAGRVIQFVPINMVDGVAAPFPDKTFGDKLMNHHRNNLVPILDIKATVPVMVKAELATFFGHIMTHVTTLANLILRVSWVLFPFHNAYITHP